MAACISRSPADTEQAGEQLAQELHPGDVVALFGNLGAGKTQFIRGLARGLGVTDPVSSPTFAIVHAYRGRIPLYHFDMYRISGWADLESTGFFDYLESDGVCAVEWSENIEAALPENTVRVQIEPGADADTRRITILRGRKEGHKE